MKGRERLEKLRREGKEVARMPVEAAKQEIDSDSSNNEGMKGQEKVKTALRPISNKLGDMTDASRREDYLKRLGITSMKDLLVIEFIKV